MGIILGLISFVLYAFLLALLAYSILSWVMAAGTLAYDSPVRKVQATLTLICEPVLRPVRKIVPPVRVGGAAIDLSVIIVFLVVSVLASVF